MKVRLAIIFALFAGLYGVLIYKLYYLQLEKGLYYSAKAASQNAALDAAFQRGKIYFSDRSNGAVPAAINRSFSFIYSAPAEIVDVRETAALLESIVNVPAPALEKMFSKKGDLYELIVDKANSEQTAAVRSLNLKGIYVSEKVSRFYPFGDLGAQVLGFVGVNKTNEEPTGLYGAELFYNSFLAGADFNLTLDRNLQARSQGTLEKLIAEFQAFGGTLIIQEPKTGKILALANYPSFDPNFYSGAGLETFINPAIQKIYEPGSVFKIITMAAGIDAGKITPKTSYRDAGSVKIAGRVIANWDHKAHGEITMTEVIEKSVNTGAVYAEELIGHDIFYNYLIKFGFGEKTGIDLPGELSGDLRNLSKKANEAVNFATASFGQGVAVTPLQLINAVSAIANGGSLMRPYLKEDLGPLVLKTAISGETARQVSEMMVSAVEKAGVASIPGYKLAGKTGTAQIPDFQNGGYLENQFIHTYAGFGPASDPRFAILIKLDRPNSPLAALTVVPAFKNLAQFVLNYYRVPPDKIDLTINN